MKYNLQLINAWTDITACCYTALQRFAANLFKLFLSNSLCILYVCILSQYNSLLAQDCPLIKIKSGLKSYNLQGKVKILKEWEYMTIDKDGGLLKEDLDHDYSVTKFNFNGQIETEHKLYDDGSIFLEASYEYGLDNKLLRSSLYTDWITLKINDNKYTRTNDSESQIKWVFLYDDNSNCIYIESTGTSIEVCKKSKYDNRDNLIEEVQCDSTFIIKYYYNARNQLIRWESYEKGKLYSYTDNKLDFYGNTISKISYDGLGNITSSLQFSYSYDSQGNWVKMTRSELWCRRQYVTERKITYY